MSNNSITAYLGSGTAATRPSAPPGSISTGSESLYYATDTKVLYRWNAANSAWDTDPSVELTDGTTDLTSVTKVTVSGMEVGGTAAAGTLKTAGLNVSAVTVTSATQTLTPGTLIGKYAITLQHNVTITMSGGTDGMVVLLELIQDSTGSRTVAFDSSVTFGTDITSFTATTTANKVDYVLLQYSADLSTWCFLAVNHGF